MECSTCHHQPPSGSRFCNMCGASLGANRSAAPTRARREELRHLFIDLSDLHLPGYLGSPDHRATVTSHVYERFTPFADDGWQWTTFPGDAAFDGWVYENVGDQLTVVGVDLLCRRARLPDPLWSDPTHHVSEHRVQQLTGHVWTAEHGSKIWSSPAVS
jgi:hypothetical protein